MLLIKTMLATAAVHADLIFSLPLFSMFQSLKLSSSSALLLVPDLLQFVEQRFIADLQLLSRPASVPARPGQNLQNDFPLRLARGCPRRVFQRYLLAITSAVDTPHKGPQSAHGQRLITQSDNSSSRIFQFANISRPVVFQKKGLRLRAERRYRARKITSRRCQEPVSKIRDIFSSLP